MEADSALNGATNPSELMNLDLTVSQRMGFEWASSAPAIHGVDYGVHLKELDD